VRSFLTLWRAPVALLLLVLLGALPALAADPFGRSAGSEDEATAAPAAETAAPGLIQRAGHWFVRMQAQVNRAISRQMVEIKNGHGALAVLIGMLIAFGYGIAHAIGPGHGKAVVISYFLSREAGLRRGLVMGGQIALYHVLSAIIIVTIAHFLLEAAFSKPVDQLQFLKLLSYGGIMAGGLYMTVAALRGRRSAHDHHHGHGHAHDAHCGHVPGRGDATLLSMAVGAIPCSGAVLILVYALTNGILLSGILMTACIALGMALTLSAIGLVSIYGRRRAVAAGARRGGGFGLALARGLSIAGPLAIAGLGAVMFAGAL
jgi:nickel/cobalt transporter (NicO) family protein